MREVAMTAFSRRDIVLAGLAFGSVGGGRALAAGRTPNDEKPPVRSEGTFPSLAGATAWLNSAPLSREGLRGKTVLVNFWTYSCINWMRAHPYVRAWSRAYADQGMVAIGVHTPEFDFERNVENVARAARANDIDYPIAIDNDSVLWRAFSNQYWPALYVIDARGRMRHHRFGEGDYAASEDAIGRGSPKRARSVCSQGRCCTRIRRSSRPTGTIAHAGNLSRLRARRALRFRRPTRAAAIALVLASRDPGTRWMGIGRGVDGRRAAHLGERAGRPHRLPIPGT
jgi:thiol-disulfide isomerase/thioredoxin